jgi:hypothetical protein
MLLTYHADTIALLGTDVDTSHDAAALIQQIEREFGFTFPASLREWYSLANAHEILHEHSNDDAPVPIEEMLRPRTDTNGGGPHDLLSQGLIPIRYENQAVAVWAVRLDGTDDPPVVVDVDTQFRKWRPCATSFSQFLYTCVWDCRMVQFQDAFACTDNVPFDESQLDFLRATFNEGPTTSGWPRDRTYRFCLGSQALLFWADDVADWFLGADNEQDLESLIRRIGHLESLKDYLYSHTDAGNRVLARIKKDAEPV